MTSEGRSTSCPNGDCQGCRDYADPCQQVCQDHNNCAVLTCKCPCHQEREVGYL